MSNLRVEPVRTGRQRRQFIRLPWAIYRGDSCWIPPLLASHTEMLGYRHSPFYDDADIQTFLATRCGVPVGRIAAIENHAHNRRFGDRRGFFGFFESVNDSDVAAGLIDAVRCWLGERGIAAIRGPVNPSMNHECALLVDGFDAPPTFMNTYNPRYYADLLEGCGFLKSQDLYALRLRTRDIAEHAEKLASFVRGARRRLDVRFRPFDLRNFRDDVQVFADTFNRAYANVWGFVPLSLAETDHLARGIKSLITPDLTAIAEIDGRPVGAMLAILDYNPRIRAINGRLLPFGFVRLLFNRRAITSIRVMSAQVVPEYQRTGLGPLLVAHVLPALQARGIDEVEFSTVIESNQFSLATLRRLGAAITKTYRMYDILV